jgi:hypothetical protein
MDILLDVDRVAMLCFGGWQTLEYGKAEGNWQGGTMFKVL